jgi:hypothetical protein
MRIQLNTLCCLGFGFSVLFLSNTANSATDLKTNETKLKIDYSIHCNRNAPTAFPGLVVEATFQERTVRMNLFKYNHSAESLLGNLQNLSLSDLHLQVLPSENCTLDQLSPQLESLSLDPKKMSDLAILHSPYLVLRDDQVENIDRDVHLGIAYSVIPQDSGFSIRYTYFFSNETVKGLFATTKAKSLGSWGRRCDIEWIYQVDFENDGTVANRIYQGGIVGGIDHKTHKFNGEFLENTEHPILYDIAKHNVFGTRAPHKSTEMIGGHPNPDSEIKAPLARENWLWDRPWTFDVTDRELARDGKLTQDSGHYLYVRLAGSLGGGKIQTSIRNKGSDQVVLAGEGTATINSLGSDLWGVESYSAIEFNSDSSLSGGSLHIKRSRPSVNLKSPNFFRLIPDEEQGFKVANVSSQFTCASAYDCEF